jgi:hypothetical protein
MHIAGDPKDCEGAEPGPTSGRQQVGIQTLTSTAEHLVRYPRSPNQTEPYIGLF